MLDNSKDKLLFYLPPLPNAYYMVDLPVFQLKHFLEVFIVLDHSAFNFIKKYFTPIFIGNHYWFKFSPAFYSFLFNLDVYVFLQMHLK